MRQLSLTAPPATVAQALDRLREELEIPVGFPPAAQAEAQTAAAQPPPEAPDARHLPLVTIDPPGSRDLDQALHLERADEGYVVHYAIADLASAVTPGGALDQAVHERGVTVYGPTGAVPLHPEVVSAGSASLLPGEDRSAYLWRIALDATGLPVEATVRRAVVRSRAQLTYAQVQAALDDAPDPAVPDGLPELLREVGELRLDRERDRGGVSLEIPEQEAVPDDGGYALAFRATLPVEEWNAQISLLTGISAAAIMRTAGVGIVRTLPPAEPRDLARLRRAARALGIAWPAAQEYADLVRTLDSAVPAHAAFLTEATTLFRGAGYAVVDGGETVPEHAAIAAPYAHVTAPLRRLVDRYGLEVCRAVCAGEEVPAWVLEALPGLPRTMARTTQRAGRYERGAIDAIEALVLERHVGREFTGVVVDVEEDDDGARGTVVIADPAVEAAVRAPMLPLGEEVGLRLDAVDVPARSVRFSLADPRVVPTG